MQEEKHLKAPPSKLDMRYTETEDWVHLQKWLSDSSIARWFPMDDPIETEDAVNRWIGFARYRSSLTAVLDGVPCGMATLYLQPYTKLAHQCEFGIIVAPEYRNMGIGTDLMRNIINLAKQFNVTLLHLQVYSNNPAIRLYERFGFESFGHQEQWIKERDGTFVGRTFMQKNI